MLSGLKVVGVMVLGFCGGFVVFCSPVGMCSNLPSIAVKNTMIKNNLEKKGFVWLMRSAHSQSLREVREELVD